MLYGALVIAVWMADSLWQRRGDRRALLRTAGMAAAVAGIGLALASWQLLPFAEFAQLGHRTLLDAPERFMDRYRAAPLEIPLALASFNAGIELGQLAVVLALLAVSRVLRRHTRALAYAFGSLAGFWLLDRSLALFGFA